MDSSDEGSTTGSKKPKIIIIGAGISGIAAGESLTRMGFTDFKILEASSRTGGRIWSVNVDDNGHKAELGANWIHGIERNPIYQIADQNHLLQLRHLDKTLRSRDISIMENGEQIPRKIVKEVDLKYGMLIQECEEYFQSGIPTPEENDSVGAHLDRKFNEKLERYCNGDRTIRNLIYNQRKLMECCISGCDNLDDVSLSDFGCYEELPGIHYTIPPGFETILELLKKTIPKDNILLNHPVRCVYWNQSGKNKDHFDVCVECENGKRFYADHVIVTVSLGILKTAQERMFNPPLPLDKQHAIDSLGFGIVDKVMLQFDEPIVEPDVHRVEFLWNNESISKLDLPNTWYRKIYSFQVIHDNILLGWVCGKEALYMESLTEEQIAQDCIMLLKKFLKKQDIPLPKRVIRTRWGNSQYTKGSYSYIRVGSTVSDIESLIEPLGDPEKPQVMFAGEATHPSFYSTTHGALLTGYREADRISEIY